MYTFSAKVGKIDINAYVQVPDDILLKLQKDAKKEKAPIPVKGTLQGKPFLANVVRYRDRWRLYLNSEMRHAANVDVGHQVTVELPFDSTPPNSTSPARAGVSSFKEQTGKAGV